MGRGCGGGLRRQEHNNKLRARRTAGGVKMADGAKWQCVMIAWGDRYPVAEINLLIATIRRLSHGPARFVLITDRVRPGLDGDVVCRDFPAYFLQDQFREGGCQAKLCMFEAGVLPTDMPAIYMDLDTFVMGDVSRFLGLMKDEQTVAVLQSAILPFGAFARWLYRVTGKKRYARGNSSIIVFHPARCAYVAETFRDLVARYPWRSFRPTIADERFISWVAQPHMVAVPRHLAVKFPTEFMQHWVWLTRLYAALPGVRARREGLIAVTLPGVEVKGEELLRLEEGAQIVDRKGRVLIWSDQVLGSLRGKLIDYYKQLA